MNERERKYLETNIHKIISGCISSEYAKYILKHKDRYEFTIMDYIIDDVIKTPAWKKERYCNDEDIKLVIGRILMNKLEISY